MPGVVAAEPNGSVAATVAFAFNLGLGQPQTSAVRRRVNQRDWPSTAYSLHRWVWQMEGAAWTRGSWRSRACTTAIKLSVLLVTTWVSNEHAWPLSD